ncbi:MAG: alpha-1,2-fucosyltransferase [Clostridium sp.]
MIIMHVLGGLGNQMFQYALYLKLKSLGKEVRLDIGSYSMYQQHNGFEIEKIFDTTPEYMTVDDIQKFVVPYGSFVNGRIVRSFVEQKTLFKFEKHIFELHDHYLYGYWPCSTYFKDIKDIVRKEYTFKNPLDDVNEAILNDIKSSNSVCLHVRRGDYLSNEGLFVNLGKTNYYENAIKYIQDNVENPKFFIFSNDIQWVKDNLKIDNEVVYVENNAKENSYKDMQLMSNCKHCIMANSSFSWWAAWLNDSENKIILIPHHWFNIDGGKADEMELFEDHWIQIEYQYK